MKDARISTAGVLVSSGNGPVSRGDGHPPGPICFLRQFLSSFFGGVE